MAKKKKPQQHPMLSPAKYIRLKARALPIAHCYVNGDWQESGIAFIFVIRQHQSGNYTAGKYLVDTFCRGVKDTMYQFNFAPNELDELMEQLPGKTEITYNEAHNIIFGAIAFAEEAGMTPHPSFELTQYLLEEDTDEIPLIEYEFGKDGAYFFLAYSRLEASEYLPILCKNLGYDVPFSILDLNTGEYDDDDEDVFSDIVPEAVDKFLENMETFRIKLAETEALPHTTYAYIHPEYPATLELTHHELQVIYNKEYRYALPRKIIKQLLALPRKSLLADLDRIILYELGKACKAIMDELQEQYNKALTHTLFLLGELKAAESLQTVLEILRQNRVCLDNCFGNSDEEVFRLTLYYIGNNQTDALFAFMTEPGLERFSRIHVLMALSTIAHLEPERRDEVIDWFHRLLIFLRTNISDTSVYDATVAASLVSKLIEINARELLPEIKKMYDTGLVDLMYCGNYQKVEHNMLKNTGSFINYSLLDIYQRYQQYEKNWKQ